MKEKDIHRYIEEQDREGKQAIKAKIDAQLSSVPAPVPAPVVTKKNTWHIFSWATACICAICLAVAMPFLFTADKSKPSERFSSTESDYQFQFMTQTLKEYGAENDLPLLYLDWYDNPDMEIYTKRYTRKDGKPSFYLVEEYADGEIDITININDADTNIDTYEAFWKYEKSETIDGVKVQWVYSDYECSAAFAYKGYKYFIIVADPPQADTAVRIAEMLLQSA